MRGRKNKDKIMMVLYHVLQIIKEKDVSYY